MRGGWSQAACCALIALGALVAPVVADAQAQEEEEEEEKEKEAGPTAVVVAGLRPSTGDYGPTDLARLPEAQQLREIVDDLVPEIARRPILNHAALRAALGSSYLVELFDCSGKVACVIRIFAPLRERASLVVYGDYTAKRGKVLVRLRLLDLAKGSLLAEEEFSLEADEIREPEKWKEEISRLLATISSAEDAGTAASGGADGGGGGEAAGGGGAEGGGSGAAAATSEDELSDADFGVEVSNAPVATVRPRGDLSWLDLGARFDVASRRFDFESAPGMGALKPDGFRGQWAMRPGAIVELYPLALRRKGGLLEGLGLIGEYGRALVGEGASAARDSRLHVALGYRLALGASDTLPIFKLTAGYLWHEITVDDDTLSLPDATYAAGAIGADVHFPIGTPLLAVRGLARYLIVGRAGDIVAAENFGGSKVAGLELDGALELRPLPGVFARAGMGYSRFVFDFDGSGAMSGPGAIGARDRIVSFSFAAGLLLR